MRNDKERQAFVQDDSNWHRVGTDIIGRVRLRELEYHDRTWYRLDTLQEYEVIKKPPTWTWLRYYKIDKKTGAFITINRSTIIDDIKQIDKEERRKK